MEKIYLSKRDLATLLGKLDSVRDGGTSSCTIIKSEFAHPLFPQTLRRISVMATEAQEQYLPGVSPRLHLARSTLTTLMVQLEQQSGDAVRVDAVEVVSVPDEQYYVDRSDTEFAPVGDLSSAFARNRGK